MKYLIVKIGAIGDVVMALPMLRQIRENEPNAHISWICGKTVANLLTQFEEIDELIVVDETKLMEGSIPGRIFEILRIWKSIAFRRFDCQLYFYYSNLYKILLLPAFFKEIRRFNKNPSKRLNPVPARHHSASYVATFQNLEGPFELDLKYPKFRFQNDDHKIWREKIKTKSVVVLSCGGAKNFLRSDDLRRWPIEHYVALAEKLVKAGFEVVLSGGPGDAWVTEHFQNIPHQSFIGKLDLNNFIAFLSVCDVLITHDSGPLHLADLANCPVVGLFGPTNPGDFRSLQTRSVYLWGGEYLHCRPCYDGRMYAACSNAMCLKSLAVEDVFHAALRVENSARINP